MIPAGNSIVNYSLDGEVSEFVYNFKIYGFDELKVSMILDDVKSTLAKGDDYEVTEYSNTGGKIALDSVKMELGIFDEGTLVIERVPVFAQGEVFREKSNYPAAAIERMGDKLFFMIHYLYERVRRGIFTSIYEDFTSEKPLPVAGERAGKFLHFDENGDPETIILADGVAQITEIGSQIVEAETAEIARSVLGVETAATDVTKALMKQCLFPSFASKTWEEIHTFYIGPGNFLRAFHVTEGGTDDIFFIDTPNVLFATMDFVTWYEIGNGMSAVGYLGDPSTAALTIASMSGGIIYLGDLYSWNLSNVPLIEWDSLTESVTCIASMYGMFAGAGANGAVFWISIGEFGGIEITKSYAALPSAGTFALYHNGRIIIAHNANTFYETSAPGVIAPLAAGALEGVPSCAYSHFSTLFYGVGNVLYALDPVDVPMGALYDFGAAVKAIHVMGSNLIVLAGTSLFVSEEADFPSSSMTFTEVRTGLSADTKHILSDNDNQVLHTANGILFKNFLPSVLKG